MMKKGVPLAAIEKDFQALSDVAGTSGGLSAAPRLLEPPEQIGILFQFGELTTPEARISSTSRRAPWRRTMLSTSPR
jgi:hypothetical protein